MLIANPNPISDRNTRQGIEWLDENQDADADECKAQKLVIEDVVQPIVSGLYKGGAGAAGGDDFDEKEDHDEL
jgi:hypothetical protein